MSAGSLNADFEERARALTSSSAPRRPGRSGWARRRRASRRRSSPATPISSRASSSTICGDARGGDERALPPSRGVPRRHRSSVELAERSDELENAILAARVEFAGEELPLRSAQAMLALLDDYAGARGARASWPAMRPPRSTTSGSTSCGRRGARGRALRGAPTRRAQRGRASSIDLGALARRSAGRPPSRQRPGAPLRERWTRPPPRRGARGRAGVVPRRLPAPHVAARLRLHEGAAPSPSASRR